MNPVILAHNHMLGCMGLAILIEGELEVPAIKRLTEAHSALRSQPMELMFITNHPRVVVSNVGYPA